MAAQCDPAKLLNLEADLIEHFQLPQCCINTLAGAVSSPDGRFIVSITVTDYADFNESRFMRLSNESFTDLEESQLEVLNDLCHAAHPSEEFFVTDATNQWLRTAIKPKSASVDLFSLTLTEAERRRNTIIHSNVLPYEPFWTRPLPARDGASRRVHLIPCCIFREAIQEGSTFMRKLQEWTQENGRREECDVGKHVQLAASKKVWDINPLEVVPGKIIAPRIDPYAAQVSQVTWRGGYFIEKDTKNPAEFAAEVNIMERLCHPHIVYMFGINCVDGDQGSLYMEWMERDLRTVILDPAIRPDGDNMGPPFSHPDSVDILLQIAKAMAYMHENKVIHGDLKSPNILISPIKISERQKRYHYLAKVADFGSAQILENSGTFKPPVGTTQYAAPEVLKFRKNKDVFGSVPEDIDIYSFGLVAFEVLTGKDMDHVFKNVFPLKLSPSHEQGSVIARVKEGVISGALKPPLREECQKVRGFPRMERLISLIERCWHGESDPSKRPSFSEIVEVLNSFRVQIDLAPTSQSDIGPPRHARLVDDGNFDAPEEAASRTNVGHHRTSSDQANNTSVAPREQNQEASGSNGRHSPSLDPAVNTSVALPGQIPGSPRRQNRRQGKLRRILGRLSCVSGGKVKN